jgi:hypothetical protein
VRPQRQLVFHEPACNAKSTADLLFVFDASSCRNLFTLRICSISVFSC